MNINYWTTFSKRKNSTKQPSSGTQAAVYLKEPCNIASPSFICNTIPDTVKYIEAFGRYYFVSDVTHDGSNIIISCVSDPMATFKSDIASYSGFVEYTSASSDVITTDPRNKPTNEIAIKTTNLTITSSPFSALGCYILGVLSNDSSGAGGVLSYYAVDAANLMLVCSELYDHNFIEQIKEQFVRSQDSLISCIWIPISMSSITGVDSQPIHIGRETLSYAVGKKITDRVISASSGLTDINYTYGGGAGGDMNYLSCAPYTTMALYLPFVGMVPADPEIAAYTKKIQLNFYIDVLTGDIVYVVKYGAPPAAQFNGNIGTKMPISSASYDGVGVATGAMAVIGGIVGTAATIATEGGALPIIGSIGAIASGAVSAAKSAELHTMINGSNSSAIGAQLGLTPVLETIQYVPEYTTLDALKSEQGLPYFKVAQVSSLSGYIKFNNAQIAISGFDEDRETINTYLNRGFYYE